MTITIIAGHSTLGWAEIQYYGLEDLEYLNQLGVETRQEHIYIG